MSQTLAVRLPDEIDRRLTELVELTGRPKSHYLKEALLEHLDDIEDAAIAAERYREVIEGRVQTVSWDEVRSELGFQ